MLSSDFCLKFVCILAVVYVVVGQTSDQDCRRIIIEALDTCLHEAALSSDIETESILICTSNNECNGALMDCMKRKFRASEFNECKDVEVIRKSFQIPTDPLISTNVQ
ncbi:hypothetical protein D915_007038 [Fasciola hepatica]|uniref:Cysteine rich repeat-containing domain protein n=1 Tax=Fasciola hepatica TaxID=6192 RepID=A0A4E0RWH9_FASHE|nr:hypothetical protein D915_007038 [Fasciola hepatica]